MKTWWQNLSVSKKLYAVVGVMAILIATELGTLYFAMTTLSAVRGFVGGEGAWSKAQKTAVYNLQRYSNTRDPLYFERYKEQLKIPLGDHDARVEIEKVEMNMTKVRRGFEAGAIHPDDVKPMVKLVRKFYNEPHLALAIEQWRKGDELLVLLMAKADELHAEIQKGNRANNAQIEKILDSITKIDEELTAVETKFSTVLGEASRWLEKVLMLVLLLAVFTVESTGIFMTYRFARGLNRVLNELNDAALSVGQGNFNVQVPVRSKDELGTLAESLNKMILNLRSQIRERQSAEHASETKNLFLANMSHEIRTPLSAILGFSELLSDPKVTAEERKRFGDIIKRTGAGLTAIINDILDISKVEAEKIEIQTTTFSLSELLSDLYRILSLRSQEKGIELTFRKHGEVPDYLYSDPLRLRQIIANVVGNSIKFTESGSVEMTYSLEGKHLVFRIADTGGGIPNESVDRLFKPFSQGDDSVRKKFGGTGLGLLISRKLAELLGGGVSLLHNNPGVGAVFEIKIEFKAAHFIENKDDESPINTETENILEGIRLLVAEDVLDNQLLVELFLTRAGATVEFAHNGKVAIEKAMTGQYDMILMDIQMPVLDGYSATRELRKRGLKTPIVAVTGYAMKEDASRCVEAGCNGVLTKPFDRDRLIRSVLQHSQSPDQAT